ncbi:hypothetical protein [Kitasatospora sp. NPDC088783]|uniref:hypothetical protein n=1 Tax=Kitasatospora sp. NPDC088783 TaxID=3364077 RepID=UPI0037FB725E
MASAPLPSALQPAQGPGAEIARLVGDLVQAAADGNEQDLHTLVERARAAGTDAGAAAVLTVALTRNAPPEGRTAGGAPDMGALPLTRAQDLHEVHLADNPTVAAPARVRQMGPRARAVMQKAADVAQPLSDADRGPALRKLYTEQFRDDRDISEVVLRLLAQACVPVLHGSAAETLAQNKRIAALLDRVTDRSVVDQVLDEARRGGVDLEELQRAAADRIGGQARRSNGTGAGLDPQQLARIDGLNALSKEIRAGEQHPDADQRMFGFLSLVLDAARTGDWELVAAVTEVLQADKSVPNIVGVLLSNINRACPDDTRRPDGRPDLLSLSGAADRERFEDRAARGGDAAAGLEWESARAVVDLLEAATAQITRRGHQAATMKVLRKGFAAARHLEAPAVRMAAEMAAMCMAGLETHALPGRWQADTEGFFPTQDPASLVLPPQPLPGGRPYDGDPADFDYEQPVASRVPRWRNRMLRQFDSPETAVRLAGGIDRMTLTPAVASRFTAAQIVIGQESARLKHGRVYHLNERLTRLATAQRHQPRDLPVTWERLPTRTGFMGFARPIAALPDQPVVAVSWGEWHAGWEPRLDARPHEAVTAFGRPVWKHRHPHPDPAHRRAYFHGTCAEPGSSAEHRNAALVATSSREWLWVTFYAAHTDRDVPLAWCAQTVVPIGAYLPQEAQDADAGLLPWLRTLMATWDRLTDPDPHDVAAVIQEVRLPRPDNRTRSKKGKKPAPSTEPLSDTVYVVTDREVPRRPAAPPADQGVIPAPRPEPQYGLVIQTKGTQNHCFAPSGEHRRHLEAGLPCPHHRDVPLKPRYRRYSDLPLRPPRTVHKPE